mgnify:FL=1
MQNLTSIIDYNLEAKQQRESKPYVVYDISHVSNEGQHFQVKNNINQ